MSILFALHQLSCAEELWRSVESGDSGLQQVAEVSIEEFLGRPNYPCVLRGVPILEYSNPVVERVAKTFTSEAELLATFTGTKLQDMAFSGLSDCPYRYEGLYPEPLEDNYIKVNAGLDRDDIGHVSLLANGGLAWTGWHLDSDPGGAVISQLQRGRKLWFFTTNTREIKFLCCKNRGRQKSVGRSLPATMEEDLRRTKHNQYCIQEPGDVVLFSSLTAHAVLTGFGANSLLTTAFEVTEEESKRVERVGKYYQPKGSRKEVFNPGSMKRGRGKRIRRF